MLSAIAEHSRGECNKASHQAADSAAVAPALLPLHYPQDPPRGLRDGNSTALIRGESMSNLALSGAADSAAADGRSVRERLDAVGRSVASASVWRRTWQRQLHLVLVAVDTIVVAIALVATYLVRFGPMADVGVGDSAFLTYDMVAITVGLLWLLFLASKDSRRGSIMGAGLEEYRRVLSASFYTFGVVAILSYLLRADVSRAFFIAALPVGTLLLLAGRWVARSALNRARVSGRALTPTLIIGDETEVRDTLSKLRRQPGAGFVPTAVCLAGENAHSTAATVSGLPAVRGDELLRYVGERDLGAIVIAGGLARQEIRELAWQLENSSTQLMFVPRLTDVAGPRLSVTAAQGLDLLHVELPRYSGAKYWLKRSFDVAFAATALVALAPVMAIIALAIKIGDGGPIVFNQDRVGHQGRPFRIQKFRTMHLDAESLLAELRSQSMTHGPLFKMDLDPRVTPVGRILRKYSLDELPQFWTVLRGHMSIVGPRPHLAHELTEFPDAGLRRLLIKPGITGLWQVSGRSDLSLEDSIRLDLRYVENWSLTGDVAIILKTIRAVLRSSGAY